MFIPPHQCSIWFRQQHPQYVIQIYFHNNINIVQEFLNSNEPVEVIDAILIFGIVIILLLSSETALQNPA